MTTTTCYGYIDSPLGRLCVQGDGFFVTGLYLPHHKGRPGPDAARRRSDSSFAAVREQLGEYFAGDRRTFTVPLQPAGAAFQLRVWRELERIPYGTTMTYGQLPAHLGQPTAARAVGNANGRNPISILVPCHRVIGSDGKLTGYAGGVEKKQWLLEHERAATTGARPADRPARFTALA